eukprot:1053661-Prymnesium_polylepis.2
MRGTDEGLCTGCTERTLCGVCAPCSPLASSAAPLAATSTAGHLPAVIRLLGARRCASPAAKRCMSPPPFKPRGLRAPPCATPFSVLSGGGPNGWAQRHARARAEHGAHGARFAGAAKRRRGGHNPSFRHRWWDRRRRSRVLRELARLAACFVVHMSLRQLRSTRRVAERTFVHPARCVLWANGTGGVGGR